MSFYAHLCFEGGKGGEDKEKGKEKEISLKLNILFQGMKPWNSAADTILQQNCSNEVAKIREPRGSKQLNK